MRYFLIFWTITTRQGYSYSGVYPYCTKTFLQKRNVLKLIQHSHEFLDREKTVNSFVNDGLIKSTLALTNIIELTKEDFYEFSELDT